jgi:superfamily II DNA or RNA helicase
MKVSLTGQKLKNNELINEYGFITYGWSFPEYFSGRINNGRFPRIKSGYHWNVKDDGTKRMNQACSKGKTSNGEEPFPIPEALQKWIIPISISESKPNAAQDFSTKFDKRCNKELKKYRKGGINKYKGEEWYDISIEDLTNLRSTVFEKLVKEYGATVSNKKLPKLKLDYGKKEIGLQKVFVRHFIEDFLKGKQERAKGIAPTGFGKTIATWFSIVESIKKGLTKNRISVFTAPTQFLAYKNTIAFRQYGNRNEIKKEGVKIVNITVYSGSDIQINSERHAGMERKEIMQDIISGYLTDPDVHIVFHTCSHSMSFLDEVLAGIGIKEIDYAICDEAHTLASTRNNRRNFILSDGLVKINKRLFITATEKNLNNPDDLRAGMINNFMNNPEVFGETLFKYSYADGVANEHILPFITHVFEYVSNGGDILELMSSLKEMDIEELQEMLDEDYSISPKMVQSIISSMKVVEEHGIKKLIILCSRNNHARTLAFALEHLQSTQGKLKDVNIVTVTADQYDPGDRANKMDEIHESDEKHIVIVGPWAITGIDCPSLDGVLWNFIPGSEISVAQGTGRGSRLSKGKEFLTVFFNIDLGKTVAEIRNSLISTIQKLYEAQFPSHDVTIKNRVRRILGRRFLTRTETDPDMVEPLVRASLEEVYESVATVNLTDQIMNLNSCFKIKNKAERFIDNLITDIEGSKTMRVHSDGFRVLHPDNTTYIQRYADTYSRYMPISYKEAEEQLSEFIYKLDEYREKVVSRELDSLFS